jgi:RimJ/RimL family protein N-acetyltransferase
MSPTVSIRPLQESDLARVWDARVATGSRLGLDTSEGARRKLAERVAQSGRFANGEILLGIVADGALAGEIQARQPEMGLPPGVFEIGIEVYDPATRGAGIGRRALAQFLRHLFEEEHAHRVQLTTDVDNAAMRRVSERLGFRLEGTLTGFMPTPDGPRDYLMYAMTTGDYEEARERWTPTA